MNEESQEMIISYETVYELLRREKSRDEVQKLPDNFVKELSRHVEGLKQQINKKRREIDSFSGEDIRKEEQKYYSLQRIVSELYEKRERKIINMAITKSRTDAKLADVANLIDIEKEFFNSLVEVLNYYREVSLNQFLARQKEVEKPKIPEKGEESAISEQEPKEKPVQPGESKKNRMVRFLHAVPRFFDKEMNVLGPFEPDEIANLPGEIVDILISKGRAEEIESGE